MRFCPAAWSPLRWTISRRNRSISSAAISRNLASNASPDSSCSLSINRVRGLDSGFPLASPAGASAPPFPACLAFHLSLPTACAGLLYQNSFSQGILHRKLLVFRTFAYFYDLPPTSSKILARTLLWPIASTLAKQATSLKAFLLELMGRRKRAFSQFRRSMRSCMGNLRWAKTP